MKRLAALLAIASLPLLPSAAGAGVVTGTIANPALPGGAWHGEPPPLITRVSASYDSDSGRSTVDVAFAAPVSPTSPYALQIALGHRAHGRCSYLSPGVQFTISVLSDPATAFFNRWDSIAVYPTPATWDAAHSLVHLETTQAEAAGARYDCATGHVVSDASGGGYSLRGFRLADPDAPPPSAPMPEPVKLSVRAQASRCPRAIVVRGAQLDPLLAPGRIVFTLRGPGVVRRYSVPVLSGQDSTRHEFRRLPRGRYSLTAHYTGGVDATQEPPQPFAAGLSAPRRFGLLARC